MICIAGAPEVVTVAANHKLQSFKGAEHVLVRSVGRWFVFICRFMFDFILYCISLLTGICDHVFCGLDIGKSGTVYWREHGDPDFWHWNMNQGLVE